MQQKEYLSIAEELSAKSVDDIKQIFRQPVSHFCLNDTRHASIERLGNPPGDTGHGIGVTAQGDSKTYCAFEVRRIQETNDSRPD